MSLAAWNPAFQTRSERSIGCIWLRGIQFVSACKTPPPHYSESASPLLSQFAEIENGHCCAKSTRIAPRTGLVLGIPQRGAGSSSRPRRSSSADGNCRDSRNDYMRDLSHSLCLRGCDLHTHHVAREPKGHAAISFSCFPLCRDGRSLCLDFSEPCCQHSDSAFSLGDLFVFPGFLCSQRDGKLRRGFDIRAGDRRRNSHMGTACLSRN